MTEHIRKTRKFTISPQEAAALDRLLDSYLTSYHSPFTHSMVDPGVDDLAAFKSRLEHAQMDHAKYTHQVFDCAACPEGHTREMWHSLGMLCGRCGKHTGNNNQGHYWGLCKVTHTVRELHFCCPDDCELGDV